MCYKESASHIVRERSRSGCGPSWSATLWYCSTHNGKRRGWCTNTYIHYLNLAADRPFLNTYSLRIVISHWPISRTTALKATGQVDLSLRTHYSLPSLNTHIWNYRPGLLTIDSQWDIKGSNITVNRILKPAAKKFVMFNSRHVLIALNKMRPSNPTKHFTCLLSDNSNHIATINTEYRSTKYVRTGSISLQL